MIVRHHPARHPFVDHVGPPQPAWSAPVWDVAGLVGDGVDVVHLHFGFEDRDTADLARWCEALRAAGIGLVFTVHDLANPHLCSQREHRRRVGLLVERAAAVATLTPSAADEIGTRFGRAATVLPHPHVVPLAEMARRRRLDPVRRGIYVHAATGRPNLDLDAVARAAVGGSGREVVVHARPQAPAGVLEPLGRLAAAGAITLDIRPRLSDAELWDRLAAAELLLLPYRWGTHSGLLEAAHDLGTPVLAPSFGGYRDQGAHTYDDDPGARIACALRVRPTVDVHRRREAGRAVRLGYDALYRQATATP